MSVQQSFYYQPYEILFTIMMIYSVNHIYNEYKDRQYWNRVFKYFDTTCNYINTFCNIHTTNVHVNKSEEIVKLLSQAIKLYKDVNLGTSNISDQINQSDSI